MNKGEYKYHLTKKTTSTAPVLLARDVVSEVEPWTRIKLAVSTSIYSLFLFGINFRVCSQSLNINTNQWRVNWSLPSVECRPCKVLL